MKKISVIIILQIFCISILLPAAEQKSFTDSYTDALDLWVNDEISLPQLLNLLSDLDLELDNQPLNSEIYYLKSRNSLLRGQIYYEKKDKTQSISELEDCLKFAKQANEINSMSKNLSTMAMANSLLMVQKGLLFIIANFTLPKKQMEQALKLDPRDYQALLVKSQFLSNAPPIAGGNLETGINILLDLSKRSGIRATDRFYILQTLAEIYRDEKRKDDSALVCRQALTIFPGNKKCMEILLELDM